MTKRVRVTILGIENVSSGPDPGSNLEIYGDLHTKRVFVNDFGEFETITENHMWHRGDGNRVDLSQGAFFPLTDETSPVEIGIEPGEFLWLGGHIAEHDTFGPNDNMGFRDRKVPHDHIGSEMLPVDFDEGGQHVVVKFRTTVL